MESRLGDLRSPDSNISVYTPSVDSVSVFEDLELRPFIPARTKEDDTAGSPHGTSVPPPLWFPYTAPRKIHRRVFKSATFYRLGIFYAVLLLGLFPILLVRILGYPKTQSGGILPWPDCTFSGKFTFQGIDLPVGSLSFASAKALDLLWNTIAGRAMQAAVGFIAYRVFMKAMVRLAETEEGVGYELFAAMAFYPTSVVTIWHLLKMRGRWTVMWLGVSVAYLLAFPTMMDAVSGYQATQITTVREQHIHGMFSFHRNHQR